MEFDLKRWGFPEGAKTVKVPVPTRDEAKGWGKKTLDKSSWRKGPWNSEPDKVVWVDPETGLDCMIIRSRSGSLCGYVGVERNHPWWEVEYNACVNRHAPISKEEKLKRAKKWVEDAQKRMDAGEDHVKSGLEIAKLNLQNLEAGGFLATHDTYDCLDWDREDRCQSPEAIIEVHGGLTYSGSGLGPHPVSPQKEDLFWFGFDCAHYMDFAPGMDAISRSLNLPSREEGPYDEERGILMEYGQPSTYRDITYVKAEVESLAHQLKTIQNGVN